MGITIYEFINLFTDYPDIRVFNIAGNDCPIIYEGDSANLPYEYEDIEISSVDVPFKMDFDGYIGINVVMGEEDD